ncbi:MAG: hypothetical protein A4E53_00042 [Pelotomaculum sp. PtaB.Bin104]|nr:MAG: hypothetical protein A4E53_00042 [Pelotomaculum sp. PtaB.Bin104]
MEFAWFIFSSIATSLHNAQLNLISSGKGPSAFQFSISIISFSAYTFLTLISREVSTPVLSKQSKLISWICHIALKSSMMIFFSIRPFCSLRIIILRNKASLCKRSKIMATIAYARKSPRCLSGLSKAPVIAGKSVNSKARYFTLKILIFRSLFVPVQTCCNIFSYSVSSPTATTTPWLLPLTTLLPLYKRTSDSPLVFFATGKSSPVNSNSSTSRLLASISLRSAGTISPTCNRTLSPLRSFSSGTIMIFPFCMTATVLPCKGYPPYLYRVYK